MKLLSKKKGLIDLVKASLNFSDKQYNLSAKLKIDRFIKSHNLKFKKQCHFKDSVFLLKHKDWLEREMLFDYEVYEQQVPEAEQSEVEASVDSCVVENQEGFNEQEGLETVNQERNSNARVKRRNVSTSDYRSRIRRRRRFIKVDSSVNNCNNSSVKTVKPFDRCSRRTKARRCEKNRNEMGED